MWTKSDAEQDVDLLRRRDAILHGMTIREAPTAMFWFVVIIVIFDTLTIVSGVALPATYLLSDVAQSIVLISMGLIIQRGVIAPRFTPWAFVVGMIANSFAVNYQYTFDPGGPGIGVVIILMSAYGALTLQWRPFLAGAAVMVSIAAYTLATVEPEYLAGWLITMLTGLLVSGRILHGRRVSGLILAAAERKVEAMATRDQLTGLLNRHGLHQATDVMASLAGRNGTTMFVLFIDVAGLKQVNDHFGHEAGDLVISRTAMALKHETRAADLVARWGGDEFVIVGIGEAPAPDEVERRFREVFDGTGLEGIWTPHIHVGRAESPDASLATLIAEADAAMYGRRNGQPHHN